MSESYFTFPLAVLHDHNPGYPIETLKAGLNCMELALHCGMIGAGKGYRKNHGQEAFEEKLEEICDDLNLGGSHRPGPFSEKGDVLVGANICNVTTVTGHENLMRISDRAGRVPAGGPLVRMKGKYLWAAIHQNRAETNPSNPWPERGVSWREFRILCAILSAKTNRAEFAFIGWEMIQARACGFSTHSALKAAKAIPDHLCPPLTRQQIRATCDALEDLGFYARFRLSSGKAGGLMAYSVRHTREELAKAVCEHTNFRDRAKIRANRAEDAAKCLELLERTKSQPSDNQATPKGGTK